MRFRCKHTDKSGAQCNLYALSEKKYCRWHLFFGYFIDNYMPDRLFYMSLLKGASYGVVFVFFYLIWEFCSKSKISAFIGFSIVCPVSFTVLLSCAMILGGSSRIYWSIIFTVSIGIFSVFCFISAIAIAVSPTFAEIYIQGFRNIELPYPHPYPLLLLFSSFTAGMGATLLILLLKVLLIRIPKWVLAFNSLFVIATGYVFVLITSYYDKYPLLDILPIFIAILWIRFLRKKYKHNV